MRGDRDADLLVTLGEAAALGRRCPTRDVLAAAGFGDAARRVSHLARAGYIRLEVYARNWRVIEICDGPHKGKRTAPPPWGGKPYLVIQKGDVKPPPPVRHYPGRRDRARAQRLERGRRTA